MRFPYCSLPVVTNMAEYATVSGIAGLLAANNRPAQFLLAGLEPRQHLRVGGGGRLVLLQFVSWWAFLERIGPLRLPQPRQEIAAIPDQCRETSSFIDRLGSEASVTIFPVALPAKLNISRARAPMLPA
jgi:hypothetical protein